jgi:hypothetical protein
MDTTMVPKPAKKPVSYAELPPISALGHFLLSCQRSRKAAGKDEGEISETFVFNTPDGELDLNGARSFAEKMRLMHRDQPHAHHIGITQCNNRVRVRFIPKTTDPANWPADAIARHPSMARAPLRTETAAWS